MQWTAGVKGQVIPGLDSQGQIPALPNASWVALARSLCLHFPICKSGHLWTCLIGPGGKLGQHWPMGSLLHVSVLLITPPALVGVGTV